MAWDQSFSNTGTMQLTMRSICTDVGDGEDSERLEGVVALCM